MCASEQGNWQAIRKDATELTIADFDRFPVWSFCCDEEELPGQDENTVKPEMLTGPIFHDSDFYGYIPVEIRFNDGTTFFGTIIPTTREFTPLSSELDLWLDRPAQELTIEQLPQGWDPVIFDEATSVSFRLAGKRALSDEKALESIRLVYSVLNTTRDRMWPITITPRVAIKGWPASWQLDGWTRFNRDLSPGEVLK